MISKLELALEDCLAQIESGEMTADECLALYPDLRNELAPLLLASMQLSGLRDFKVRPEFKSRTRTLLAGHMYAHPRRKGARFSVAFRYAATLAVLVIALATTGTAIAQRALPGDFLYSWKLASEQLWRGFQNNSVEADITLANRRISELGLIRGVAQHETIGVEAYLMIIDQLRSDLANQPESADSVNQVLLDHREMLQELFDNSQAELPELEEVFGPIGQETAPADGAVDGGDDSQMLPLPVLATLVPPAPRKDEDKGEDETETASEEEESWFEKAIDDLLGLP